MRNTFAEEEEEEVTVDLRAKSIGNKRRSGSRFDVVKTWYFLKADRTSGANLAISETNITMKTSTRKPIKQTGA